VGEPVQLLQTPNTQCQTCC